MPLTGQETVRLADEISQQIDVPSLTLLASDLGVQLQNVAAPGTLKEQALALVAHLNTRMPSRDRELLQILQRQGNGRLRTVATEMLQPRYFSPTGDAHDAILLGRTAFVARASLRRQLREFTHPSPYSTRVLVVRGSEPGGKSYSWEFLRHLATQTAGTFPQRLRLRNTQYTPREFMEQAFRLLHLDPAALPVLTDQPQLTRIDPLVNAFKGQVPRLERPYWLVLDDLNDPSVTPEIRAVAYALAYSVEEMRPPNLWLALLGYNEEITDPDLRHVAQDEAEFPSRERVAEHFVALSAPANPLGLGRAREIAYALYQGFEKLDREAMSKLTFMVEGIGEKLITGVHP
jgi:hypothetical protein